jgi:hypothetical protein
MSETYIPIACTLNTTEFHERERDVLQKLLPKAIRTESEKGYVYHFPSDDECFREIAEFIELERQCCPFLDFKLTVPRGSGEIILELSGPPGAKAFIGSTF